MTNEQKYRITAQDKTGRAVKSVKKSFASLGGSAAKLMPQLAAVAGVAGFGAMVKGALDASDRIHKLSQRTGISTEALSQMRHASELSGVSFETTAKGMEKMSRSISEAAGGYGTGKRALEDLGLSAANLKNLRPEEQFEVMADALAKVENESDRTRIAMEVFGRAGGELLPMLKAGSDGISEMRQEADKLGLTLSQDQANAAAAAKDALARLEGAGKGLAQSLAISLGPAIAAVAEWMADRIPKAIEWSSKAFSQLKKWAGDAIGSILNKLADWLDKLGELPDFLGGEKFRSWSDGARDAAETISKWGDNVEIATGKVEKFEVAAAGAGDKVKNMSEAIAQLNEDLAAGLGDPEALAATFEPLELSVQRVTDPGVWHSYSEEAIGALTTLADAGDLALSQFSSGAARYIATAATEGAKAAGKFEAVWKSAINAVIAQLAQLAIQRAALFVIDRLIPGASSVADAAVGRGPAPGPPSAIFPGPVAAPAPAAAAAQIVWVNQSLTPAGIAQRVEAYTSVDELSDLASPFVLEG